MEKEINQETKHWQKIAKEAESARDYECKQGRHNFVACDEWEPTCTHCGKFQSK